MPSEISLARRARALLRPDAIPTRGQVFDMFMALLPRGRAWQTHEKAISYAVENEAGEVTGHVAGSVMRAFWLGIATVWRERLELAIGVALNELSCSTSVHNRDAWYEEYGLPDQCDAYGGDVCAKASDAGGHSFAYYRDVVARSGWIITGKWLKGGDPAYPGVHSTLLVRVDPTSSAIPSRVAVGFRVGRRIGLADTARLQCMLDRMVPAHAGLIFEVL